MHDILFEEISKVAFILIKCMVSVMKEASFNNEILPKLSGQEKNMKIGYEVLT